MDVATFLKLLGSKRVTGVASIAFRGSVIVYAPPDPHETKEPRDSEAFWFWGIRIGRDRRYTIALLFKAAQKAD